MKILSNISFKFTNSSISKSSFSFNFYMNKNKINYFTFSSKNKNSFDPYLILDINRKATWPEIKKQYYKLARLYHPDNAKNDERTQQKFIQIKDAFEYFDRKYNPSKYSNLKPQPYTFEEETGTTENKEEKETIRKNEKSTNSARDKTGNNVKEEVNADYETEDYFRKEQVELDLKQQERINTFIKNKGPVPRSDQMIDRHKISQMTIGKGKLLGAEDYNTFMFITSLVLIIILTLIKSSQLNFDNMQKHNIYYTLKDYSDLKEDIEYKDKQMTPYEKQISEMGEYKKFISTIKTIPVKDQNNVIQKFSYTDSRIRDIPKLNIKEEFYKNS